MRLWSLLLLLVCLPTLILSEDYSDVTVIVRGSKTIAATSDEFICATLDWWPPEKCNYDQCPWGKASILNMLLAHYASESEAPYKIKCAVITFGLNALRGRKQIRKGVWGGAWNSSNAQEFMEYTVSMNYPIDSWEFGNELSGSGIGASVGAEQYGKDLVELQKIVDQLYENSSKPLVLAPGGFYDKQWFAKLLDVSGPNVVRGMTHHIYNLGAGNDPHVANRILDPQHLSRVSDTFRDLQLTVQRHGPWSAPWVGEAGGAYNSGSRTVSNTFLDSFWYLDQLGQSAKYDTKVYCRQTLIGGNYGLLDTDTYVPNPDYYRQGGIALLLINLSQNMGSMVTVRNDLNVGLAQGQGITRDSSFVHGLKRTVSWVGSKASDGLEKREEYHLTAQDGNRFARTMLLNGVPLELTEDGDIPPMYPVQVSASSPIYVAPLSIAFVVFPDFEADAC
uniref:Heparanase-like protein 1 n=1 Tax=Aegilops tauschii TaxID=37682 RepID=M8B357_AEGTA